ncbi:MAG: DUF2953 domain-containing protein [Clostridia bacterium]|nr:DUF2953 domain-containing protein [Clostridia bacterium]
MIFLWILLGIVLLILLALSVPVHVNIRYTDTLIMDIRYLFLRFKVLPAPEKSKEEKTKKEKPKSETPQTDAPKEKKPNVLVQKFKGFVKAEGYRGFMGLVKQFLGLTGTAAVSLIRKVRIREFDLYVMTGGADAAQAAILYGQACATVYPAAELLFRLTKCKKHRISVDLDYSVIEPYVILEADASMRPLHALHYLLRYAGGVLPLLKRFLFPAKPKTAQGSSRVVLKK